MAITNSCAAGREMPRISKQPILYTYMIIRTEIGLMDRPRDIRNIGKPILPIRECCTLDLVLFLSQIIGYKQKCWIQPLQYRLVASWRINNDASPPTMSKEPERKTNRYAHTYNIYHSTRDQTKQGIQARFWKGREKRSFQQSTWIRVVLRPFIKKKDKKRS